MKTKKNRVQRKQEQAIRERRMQRVQIVLGYAVLGATLCWAIVLNLQHRLSPAVTVGLVILLLFRLFALRYELKRQTEEATR
jgi:FtsH-binding integral membrane protein